MAYNNFYPQYYQPIPNQAFQQNYQQNQAYQQQPQNYQQQNYQQQNMPQNQPQIQNGGFMQIPTEEMARSYPVAPGNCVTFKIEGKPIVMEKSMGFSQLEAPRIDRYRLVREEEVAESVPEQLVKNDVDYMQQINELKEQFNNELEQLRGEIDVLRGQIPKPATAKKKDVGGN